jgi:hypothetical protein
MILNSTSKTLRLEFGEGDTTTGPEYMINYVDINTTDFTPESVNGQISGSTVTTILSAPASGDQRIVQSLTIHNNDTVTRTVTVRHRDVATDRDLIYASLLTLETLYWSRETGWIISKITT